MSRMTRRTFLKVSGSGAGLLADISLMDTHYDVRDATGTHPIAAPWPVRPGIAVALGICPRL